MRYVEARLEENDRDEAYRIYISKSLQLNPQNKWITKDFYDVLYPKPTDRRTGTEIVADVMMKAGLHFEE